MSEKRFEMKIPINNGNHPLLKDNETGEIVEIVNVEMLIKKMNEQQSTIIHLEKMNGKNFAKMRLLEQDNLVLRNENEQLRKEVKNRSAFIIDKGLGDTFVRWKNE